MADRSSTFKKLIPQIRQRAFENRNGVYRPRVFGDRKRVQWPVCMTCRRDVDSVNVEDIHKNIVVIRATCHGKEAVIRMEFPYQILKRQDSETWQHVMTAINSATFFDPSIA